LSEADEEEEGLKTPSDIKGSYYTETTHEKSIDRFNMQIAKATIDLPKEINLQLYLDR
jgi:hypothetical protein